MWSEALQKPCFLTRADREMDLNQHTKLVQDSNWMGPDGTPHNFLHPRICANPIPGIAHELMAAERNPIRF